MREGQARWAIIEGLWLVKMTLRQQILVKRSTMVFVRTLGPLMMTSNLLQLSVIIIPQLKLSDTLTRIPCLKCVAPETLSCK